MRAMLPRFALGLLLSACLLAAKRPLTPADFNVWRHIQNQRLSNDGHYLAYALFPQEGDGELIVRDLATGKEQREPIGELPPPPPPNYAIPQPEDTPPPAVGIAVKFSSDSRLLVFSTFAPRAELEQGRREKRKPEDMPKGELVIMNLASGAVFRAPRVKSFELPINVTNFVAYLQAREKALPRTPKTLETGELILRNLKDGSERKFRNVAEYTLTRDGKTLVYAADSADNASGVYAVAPEGESAAVALVSGKGKYSKLAWDDEQTRLAFLAERPKCALYSWDRRAATASEIVSEETAGFPAGWVISDRSTLDVSNGGRRIFFGTARKPPVEKSLSELPADERVSVDLWSWKDDHIQPMQKIRAAVERSRSYRAAYDVTSKKFMQLADPTMYEALPSDDGSYALGSDDRAYRRMQEYDASYEDSYIVNTATGERKVVARKHTGRLSWSPDSKHALFYDGKDWITISVPGSQTINLTAKLGVSFGREEFDAPGRPPAYGLAGWTKDGKYVLLYDRFDVWQCRPDGSSAVNMTQGVGRRERIALRLVRFEYDSPDDRWINPSKPLLLRADNDDTHDSGFYRTTFGGKGAPEKLIMAAKFFAPPIKARDADVYASAPSSFGQYPDLLISDGTFHEFRKVTDANPQMAELSWGSAELVHFDSTDGKPLQGILYKPENFDPTKKYPLIVYIYERLSQGVHNFIEPRPQHTLNVSYYVSNGYLVLLPDIAYKIGYPGQSALNCVLPAIQSVVNKGFVDEHAIGIQGHSWGGYQIAYMITRTNRFRAAAAGAPVADMISAYDGIRWGPGLPRQFQYERTQSRIGGSLWEYPLRYIENSPIFMADRVTTPLLMLQNDNDDAVPWYQGIEYFLALRRLNKEVYMFTYNGEFHGLRRRADQKDYAVRLQQFFDYYLKGAEKPDWMEHGIPYIEKQGGAPGGYSDQQ
ncbi:MAG TPA: prolyl oligopeptidase family serine peptidase [Bryobacteraceae bacterium]